ncbi:MAG: prenyltransferase [Sorangiineae bacterium]|nr:prenyltransferase [Polyangiaceae bacterium]MEB2321281.1 prenyltransferase [Sorangiineae bacterium]
MAQRSKEEVLAYLGRAEVGAVGTSNAGAPRLRMMHFAADEGLDIYLTSMKGDPKITQWLNVPETALLIHQGDQFMEMEECEVIGRAEIARDRDRDRAVELLRERSPIVAQMEKQGALDRLEFIRVRPFTVKYRFVPEILQGQPPTVFDFPENRARTGPWNDLAAKARAYRAATRPLSLIASLVSVLLGGALAMAATGTLKVGLFALTLAAALLVQVGTNMINDWKDAERDGENRSALRPFSGGSRMIQLGLLSRAEMGFWGFSLSLVAAVIGAYLVAVSGWGLLPLILYGLAAGLFYSGVEGRFSFINLAPGMGEFMVATTYGVGITLGTYFVQAGEYSWRALAVSVPVALLIANVLVINSFADAESDAKTGKNTLVVRLGARRAKNVLIGVFVSAYAIVGLLPFVGDVPFTIYVVFFSLPFALRAIVHAQKNHAASAVELAPSNGHTALAHLFAGLLMVFALIRAPLGSVTPLVFLAATLGVVFWVWRYIERQRRVMDEFRLAFRAR